MDTMKKCLPACVEVRGRQHNSLGLNLFFLRMLLGASLVQQKGKLPHKRGDKKREKGGWVRVLILCDLMRNADPALGQNISRTTKKETKTQKKTTAEDDSGLDCPFTASLSNQAWDAPIWSSHKNDPQQQYSRAALNKAAAGGANAGSDNRAACW